MKYIKTYKIFEKLGYSEYLLELVDFIYDQLETADKFDVEAEMNGKKLTIEIEFNEKQSEYKGLEFAAYIKIINSDLDDLRFKMYLSEKNKDSILHELKHIDRILKRDFMPDMYWYINHIGREITEKYKDLLFKGENTEKLLTLSLYMINPDEFEAYYNQFYKALKGIVNDNMTEEEKKIAIKIFLDNQSMYKLYQMYNSSGKADFLISDFFENDEDMYEYLRYFANDILELLSNKDIVQDENDIYRNAKKLEKIINKLFNKMLEKGWKKLHNLYTI